MTNEEKSKTVMTAMKWKEKDRQIIEKIEKGIMDKWSSIHGTVDEMMEEIRKTMKEE